MGKYTIQEIAKILVDKNGLEQKAANRFATEMFALILERLQQGEQVKVKGLGTWKIIDVEARESVSVRTGERVVIDGHSKVTFTPDATMKELVNRPFSQFETVVLNNGVEFEDLKDDLTEEELKEEEALGIEEESVVIPEEPAVIPEESAVIPEESAVIPEESAVIPEEPAIIPEESADNEEEVGSDVDDEKHLGKWLLSGLSVLVLMVASALGGYYYGSSANASLVPDTVVVKDTVYVASTDSLIEVEASEMASEIESGSQSAEPVAQEKTIEQGKEEIQEQSDPYAAKDERVRLGAYRIVGLDHTVKVLEGQTFYSICRAHLGPDMECYVEVYNDLPRNPSIKAGQTIKIPKLQLKKRRKK